MSRDGDDVTGMLVAWGQGDQEADSRLIAVVYEDLRRVARRRLRGERADHSLAPTALVHDPGGYCRARSQTPIFFATNRVANAATYKGAICADGEVPAAG
jgi:hypothetical protein